MNRNVQITLRGMAVLYLFVPEQALSESGMMLVPLRPLIHDKLTILQHHESLEACMDILTRIPHL